MSTIGLSALILILVAVPEQPPPKSPDHKDREIDHGAALNDFLSKGITPQTNANVLIIQALGPKPDGGDGLPAAYFKRLGIEPLPEKGDYFIGLTEFATSRGLKSNEPGDIDGLLSRVTQRPWAEKDYSHIAQWLMANEKPLVHVVAATRRRDYYNPPVLPQAGEKPGSLLDASYPGLFKTRELGMALSARAMLRVAEGNHDQAWQDLLACHRLARLIGRGGTLIEGVVGIALEMIAKKGSLAYLSHTNLNSRQIQKRAGDLQALRPLAAPAEKLEGAERYYYLDWLQQIRWGRNPLGSTKRKPTTEELQTLSKIDWKSATRNGNRLYDRLTSAMSLKDRFSRTKAFDAIEVDLKHQEKATAKQLLPLRNLLGGSDAELFGKPIGNILVGSLSPTIRQYCDAHDRALQTERNLHLAFALAAHRADTGRYPAKLDDLAPKYLGKVPDDLFAAKPLVYKPMEKGYLLYSLGIDGKDGGGRSYDADPPGDDLTVRMPLPALKPDGTKP